MWYVHTIDYYPALKEKETLQYAKLQMNLEYMRLNEISQLQKHKYCMILPICSILKCQINRLKEWDGGCQRQEGWENGIIN